jgi:hypothetical protein
MSLLFRRRHEEVLAGGARYSGLRSLRELVTSFGFADEWLEHRAGRKSEWCLAVDAAVRERAVDVARADIAGHSSLRGFAPHPNGISRYLDDRSNIRGTRMVTKVWLGHLMVLATGHSGSYAALATYPGQVRAVRRRD